MSHQWIIDSMSRVTSYINPTGQTSHYNIDSLGRNFKIEFPNGFSVTRKYNSLGQIKEEIFGSGVKFEYSFDAANRLNSIKNTIVPASIHSITAPRVHL